MTDRRAWGWVRHLRDGGTTPWADWTAPGPPSGAAVPGAQQLELLRRLNVAGEPDPKLAQRIIGTSAPGRGQPDLELIEAATSTRFGPRPVDPADLRDGELLRVAASILAEDVVAAGLPTPPRAGLPRPWRTRYRLLGDPELVDPIRGQLVARGRPPGGRSPVILILATDLGRMLADLWTSRAFGVGAPGWRVWLSHLERGDHLPRRIDPLRIASTWADRVGRDRVHVVLDRSALPPLLGVRRLVPAPTELAAEAPDLARRVATVLGLYVPPGRRTALLRHTLRPRLAQTVGAPLVVPGRQRDWLNGHAERVADGLTRAGYAVHGDPTGLVPHDRAGVEAPSPSATLALAIETLLAGRPDVTTSEETA